MDIQTENAEETAARQALRMRRFFIAVITYTSCGALAQIYAWMGYLPLWLPLCWVTGAILVNGTFFLILHRGWNLTLRDPSMTQIQLIVSMIATMVLVFFADQARGALLMLLPVSMLFGVFRLNGRQMVQIGAIGVFGYAGVIVLSIHLYPNREPLDLELLYLGSLAVVMLYVCLMCGYISKMREDLAAALTKIRELAQRDPLTGLFNPCLSGCLPETPHIVLALSSVTPPIVVLGVKRISTIQSSPSNRNSDGRRRAMRAAPAQRHRPVHGGY